MKMPIKFKSYCLLTGLLASGCGAMSEGPAKKPPANLIATPASYYSTTKARYLGSKYKDNLDRLAEKIVRHPATMQLQFANNISSVGGIGFFTHSATKTADERYLEVVLATPETFESKGDYSEKVHHLFSRYGQDLLSILVGDREIFQDKELAGYGLNLNWRTVITDGSANRVSLARAVVYFHKERVAGFVRRSINQNDLLSDAVIFAVEDDGPLQLVSYQPRENKPDSRPAIREDDLAADSSAKPVAGASPNDTAKRGVVKPVAKAERSTKDEPLTATANKKETSPTQASGGPLLAELAPVPGEIKSAPLAAEKSGAPQPNREPETIALSLPPVESQSVKPVPEIVLQNVPPQKIAPPAEKDRATPKKTAPSQSKAELMKLPSDAAKGQRNLSIAVSPPETKSDPTASDEVKKQKTPAPKVTVPNPTTMPQIPRHDSTKPPDIAATRPAAESSTPTIERSRPTVPPVAVEPETRKLAAGPQVLKNPPTVAEAVVQSPVVEMKPPSSAERLASQTAPPAKLPPPPLPTPAGEMVAKSMAAETKSSSASARADVPIVPPAKNPGAVSPAPVAREVAKSPATETKASTSATQVETSSTPPAKLPELPALASSVEKLAKTPAVETKQSSSPARGETPTAPTAKSELEPSGAAAVKAGAKSPPAEAKPASPSAPSEIPAVTSGHVAARSLASGDNFNAPREPAKMDQKRHGTEQPVIKEPVERAIATAAQQSSEAIRHAPSPAPPLPRMSRAEIKLEEQVLVDAPSINPAQAATSVKPRETGSAPSVAKNEVPEPFTRPASAQSGQPEKASVPAAGEQLALLRKPVEPGIERAPVARPAPRPLQGFIIQVAFQDKQKAQSWAEKMTQRGYAVSVTEAGPEGSLRVRLGNFAVRDEAERQLQNFKQEGMSGIIINLPQAFRPEAVSSIP